MAITGEHLDAESPSLGAAEKLYGPHQGNFKGREANSGGFVTCNTVIQSATSLFVGISSLILRQSLSLETIHNSWIYVNTGGVNRGIILIMGSITQ